MASWPQKRMDELCEITSSKRIFAADYVSEGVPFYRGREITEKYKGNLDVSTELFITVEKFREIERKFGAPKQGDLLLTSVGTLGSVYVVKPGDRFYFKDGNLTWFRQFKGLDSKFLYYWIGSPQGKAELQKCTIGSSQSAFTIVLLKSMEIELPPLAVQQRIAGILSAYDELIENSQRRIKILESMARALYREWFVHFRFPGFENHPRVASPLGEIPQGWEVKKLGEICVVTDYVANGSFASLKENVKYRDEPDFAILIRGTDFNSGWNGKYVHVTEDSYRFLRKSELRPGDIVVTNVGNVGTTFFVPDLGKPMTLGPNSVLVRPHLGTNFVFHYLRSDEGQHRIRGITSGVAQPKFNKTEFRSLNVVTPPKDLLQQFDSLVAPIHAMSDKLRASCANLRRTRDLLLPRLLSGQIDVESVA